MLGGQGGELVQFALGEIQVSLFRKQLGKNEIAGAFPGLDAAGAVDAAQAVGHVALLEQELAQAVPAPEIAGIHFQRGQELGLGALVIAQILAGDAEQPQGPGVPGLEAERLEQPGLGVLRILPLHAEQAHELQGLGVAAVALQGLPQHGFRVLAALLENAHETQIAQDGRIPGVLGADGGELLMDFFQLLAGREVPQGHDPLEPKIGFGPMFIKRFIEDCSGCFMHATTVQGRGQLQAGGDGIPSVQLQVMKFRVEQPEPWT